MRSVGKKRNATPKNSQQQDKWQAKWRTTALDQTVRELRKAFSDVSANDLRKLIDEAIADARRSRRQNACEPSGSMSG